jgi:hypothetical protein
MKNERRVSSERGFCRVLPMDTNGFDAATELKKVQEKLAQQDIMAHAHAASHGLPAPERLGVNAMIKVARDLQRRQ